MAYIILPHRWQRQPPTLAVDRGHASLRGAVGLWDFGRSRQNLLTQVGVSEFTGSNAVSVGGLTAYCASGQWINTGLTFPTGDWTLVFGMIPVSIPQYVIFTGTANPGPQFMGNISGSGTDIYFDYYQSQFGRLLVGDVKYGSLNVVALTRSGGSIKSWLNGNPGGTLSTTDADTGTLKFNGRDSAGSSAIHYQFALLNEVALADSVVLSLSENLWQSFLPLQRRIYVPSTAGGGAVTVNTGAGALSIAGHAPTILGGNTNVAVGAGALTVTGHAPSVTTKVAVSVGAGALEITGHAPAIDLTTDTAVSVGAGAMTIAGQAPAITTQETVSVGVGAIALTGFAPTITTQIVVPVGAGALTLAGQAPEVQAIDYEYLNAASDVTDGNWLRSSDNTNTDLYTMLDEATADDADYIYTSTLDDECEIGLEVGSAPSIPGYMTLQIKIPDGFSPVGTLTVTLMDGASQVQQWASQSVSAGQMLDLSVTETVSNYDDLRVRLKATA